MFFTQFQIRCKENGFKKLKHALLCPCGVSCMHVLSDVVHVDVHDDVAIQMDDIVYYMCL
jgi:hypothetical protein